MLKRSISVRIVRSTAPKEDIFVKFEQGFDELVKHVKLNFEACWYIYIPWYYFRVFRNCKKKTVLKLFICKIFTHIENSNHRKNGKNLIVTAYTEYVSSNTQLINWFFWEIPLSYLVLWKIIRTEQINMRFPCSSLSNNLKDLSFFEK